MVIFTNLALPTAQYKVHQQGPSIVREHTSRLDKGKSGFQPPITSTAGSSSSTPQHYPQTRILTMQHSPSTRRMITQPQTFDITIQNGQPTYPHNPMQTGDYAKSHYSGNGGTLNTASFTSGYNAIRLDNLNWINKTGITKLCLRSSRDISGTAPTGNEYVNVYSNEFGGIGCQPKLVINYRNQSKIKNTGSTDIKGYLLIQVQFYNTSQAKWLVDNDTINETTPRTITSGNQLALDTIFNGHVRASDLTHGTGTYRVYAAFRDPEGNILRTNDDVDLEGLVAVQQNLEIILL